VPPFLGACSDAAKAVLARRLAPSATAAIESQNLLCI
jgi:hypothetical protein